MTYLISKPSEFLSRFIQHYWAIENCIPNHLEHIQRIVPNGLVEIIFYFGKKPSTINQQKSIGDNFIISGQLKDYYDLQISGQLSLFSILLKPQGLSMFTEIPANEFFNLNIPFRFVFPTEINRLEDLLCDTNSFAERVSIVENFLRKQIQNKRKINNFNRIENCIETINRAKGVIDINTLAYEACLSRKQFERTFSHFIGTSPKQFLKVIRFQNTIYEKSKQKNISLTELTYKCGYYDQSHMINDFQKLSGLPPKEYFNECEPISDYFM